MIDRPFWLGKILLAWEVRPVGRLSGERRLGNLAVRYVPVQLLYPA